MNQFEDGDDLLREEEVMEIFLPTCWQCSELAVDILVDQISFQLGFQVQEDLLEHLRPSTRQIRAHLTKQIQFIVCGKICAIQALNH